jgi:hypothetical protein
MIRIPFSIKIAVVITALMIAGFGQIVDRKVINGYLEEGEIEKAKSILKTYLDPGKVLTRPDSIYIYKNLGIIEVTQGTNDSLGRYYFFRLLEIDPSSNLSDTYAGYATLEKFSRIKKAYQDAHGGSSLVPSVVVMDVLSSGMDEIARLSLTKQFIDELSRHRIFRVWDWEEINSTLKKFGHSQSACQTKECFLDLARKMVADKMALLEFNQVDSIYSISLKYLDVKTGEPEMTGKRIYQKNRADIYLKGLPELADELHQKMAAWLNVSIQPDHAEIVLDRAPLIGQWKRIPVNAGKHLICAKAAGFETHCQELTVERNDAITYAIELKPKLAQKQESPATSPSQSRTADAQDIKDAQKPPNTVWYILGGMAAVSLLLAVVFNTAN